MPYPNKSTTDLKDFPTEGPVTANQVGAFLSLHAITVVTHSENGKLPRSFFVGGRRRWLAEDIRAAVLSASKGVAG